MEQRYTIADPDEILSPGLVVFEEIVRENVARMKTIAGEGGRLRPHCKTHKMIDVTRLEVGMGIVKHKCATFAEAEMLALGGARDVFLAYNVVGPNIDRAVRFRQHFPDVRFSVAADHPEPVDALNGAMARAGEHIHVFVDIDTGLRRTGLPPGPEARDLYAKIEGSSHLEPAGLHEEHLVIETAGAARYRPGDVEMAIPTHICPTSALHSHAWVVSDGRVRGRWEITARDRALAL